MTIVRESDEKNEPMIIFAWHRALLGSISRRLKKDGFDHFYIGEESSPKDREKYLVRFMQGEVPILVASMAQVAEGVTLTIAQVVVIMEPVDRAHCQSQCAARFVNQFFCKNFFHLFLQRAHRLGQQNRVKCFTLVTNAEKI